MQNTTVTFKQLRELNLLFQRISRHVELAKEKNTVRLDIIEKVAREGVEKLYELEMQTWDSFSDLIEVLKNETNPIKIRKIVGLIESKIADYLIKYYRLNPENDTFHLNIFFKDDVVSLENTTIEIDVDGILWEIQLIKTFDVLMSLDRNERYYQFEKFVVQNGVPEK